MTTPAKQLDIFGLPNDYLLSCLGKQEPNVFNGCVSVERYRVTVEKVEEPKEVLRERLLALLAQPNQIFKAKTIHAEAKRLGIDL